jgi:large subunit ribosomal protein L19
MEMTTVNIEARKQLDLRAGDNVRVSQKIKDKDGKTRIQIFEGMVIARKHGTEAGATFTVRRVSGGFGVEKIYPLYSPMIDKIEITKRSKVRRSKLYYIRDTALKQIRKRMKMMFVNIKEDMTLGKEEEIKSSDVIDEVIDAVQESSETVETTETPVENAEQQVDSSESETKEIETETDLNTSESQAK